MRSPFVLSGIILFSLFLSVSCSKNSSSGGGQPDPCEGVVIIITGTVTSTHIGQNTGSIQAMATGGVSFTYSINGSPFQASGNFNNLAAGNYTVTAKNSDGCAGSQQFTVSSTNACVGTIITISTNAVNTVPCGGSPGSITITANGSNGFTYSINNSVFQASNTFGNLAAGNYAVTVKDANGCTQTSSVTISQAAPGLLFAAVRDIIQSNCLSCHSGSNQQAGMNWADNCNIISQKDRIKTRAVDLAGTSNQMPQPPNPPLSVSERQKIVEWINAGGGYNN